MRQIPGSAATAIALYGVVLALLELEIDDALSLTTAILVVAGAGLLSLVAGRFVIPALDCSSAEKLETSYRTRFFLSLAVAELPALVGFVLSFIASSIVPYLVVLPFTAIGFIRLAPTTASIDRNDEDLRSRRCASSLREIFLG